MPTANRNFGDNPKIQGAGLTGFNPGQDPDFAMTRTIDGHNPFGVGADGNNQHNSGAGSPEWDDPVGPTVECD